MGNYWVSFLEMSDHTRNNEETCLFWFEMLQEKTVYNDHDFWAMLCNLCEEQNRHLILHFAQ